ncbi:hypothetical protein A9G12_08010 [Gilliamella sp. wkB112]|nr:hypothetical protein A9G12_08010 [Gilliamella apicola]
MTRLSELSLFKNSLVNKFVNNAFGCIVYFIYTRKINMDVFKRLVKGELSLAVTFWGFLIPCSVLPFVIIFKLITTYLFSMTTGVLVTIILLAVIQFIIACMVTSGIFFILRNKKVTFEGVIAFILSILNLLYSIWFLLEIIYLLH